MSNFDMSDYVPVNERVDAFYAKHPEGSIQSETFKIMERRLMRLIINPAMISAFLFGILMLVANSGLLQQPWMHVKLTLVILMSAIHGLFSRWRKAFEQDRNTRPAKFYRIWNEVPTLLLVLIVILAVVKPF